MQQILQVAIMTTLLQLIIDGILIDDVVIGEPVLIHYLFVFLLWDIHLDYLLLLYINLYYSR